MDVSHDEVLSYCHNILSTCGHLEQCKISTNLDKLIKCLPEKYLIILAKEGLFQLASQVNTYFSVTNNSIKLCDANAIRSSTINEKCEDSSLRVQDCLNFYHKMSEDFKTTFRGVQLLSKTSETQKITIQRTIDDLNKIKEKMDNGKHLQDFKKTILDDRLTALKKEFEYVHNEVKSTQTILKLSRHWSDRIPHQEADWEPISNSLETSHKLQEKLLNSMYTKESMNVDEVYGNWMKDVDIGSLSDPTSLTEKDELTEREKRQRDRRYRAYEEKRAKCPSLNSNSNESFVAKVYDCRQQETTPQAAPNCDDDESDQESDQPSPTSSSAISSTPPIQYEECPICKSSLKNKQIITTCSRNHRCCIQCSKNLKNNKCPMCRESFLQGPYPKFE